MYEDSKAEVDCNIVMNKSGDLIELQMTAEGKPFSPNLIDKVVKTASKCIHEIIKKQIEATEKAFAVK